MHNFHQHYCDFIIAKVLTATSTARETNMKYVKLKAAILAAEKEQGLDGLDFLSREILHLIASANVSGVKLRVSDVTKDAVFGTSPTVYARLNKLVEGGWIVKKADEDDKRVALIQITSMAREKLKKISKALAAH